MQDRHPLIALARLVVAATVVALDYYQLLFMTLSLPVLLASLYLVSCTLAKVFRDDCVVPRSHHFP